MGAKVFFLQDYIDTVLNAQSLSNMEKIKLLKINPIFNYADQKASLNFLEFMTLFESRFLALENKFLFDNINSLYQHNYLDKIAQHPSFSTSEKIEIICPFSLASLARSGHIKTYKRLLDTIFYLNPTTAELIPLMRSGDSDLDWLLKNCQNTQLALDCVYNFFKLQQSILSAASRLNEEAKIYLFDTIFTSSRSFLFKIMSYLFTHIVDAQKIDGVLTQVFFDIASLSYSDSQKCKILLGSSQDEKPIFYSVFSDSMMTSASGKFQIIFMKYAKIFFEQPFAIWEKKLFLFSPFDCKSVLQHIIMDGSDKEECLQRLFFYFDEFMPKAQLTEDDLVDVIAGTILTPDFMMVDDALPVLNEGKSILYSCLQDVFSENIRVYLEKFSKLYLSSENKIKLWRGEYQGKSALAHAVENSQSIAVEKYLRLFISLFISIDNELPLLTNPQAFLASSLNIQTTLYDEFCTHATLTAAARVYLSILLEHQHFICETSSPEIFVELLIPKKNDRTPFHAANINFDEYFELINNALQLPNLKSLFADFSQPQEIGVVLEEPDVNPIYGSPWPQPLFFSPQGQSAEQPNKYRALEGRSLGSPEL